MFSASLLRQPQVISPSRLNNGYRPVLKQAKETSVLIHESDEDNLMIIRAALVDDLVVAMEHAANFAQFTLAAGDCSTMPRIEALGRLAWIADLTPKSFEMFAPRYRRVFAESMLRNDWSRLEELLGRWQEPAEIEGDPELLAILGEEDRPDEFVDLERPS